MSAASSSSSSSSVVGRVLRSTAPRKRSRLESERSPLPTLKGFLHKQTVIHQYRGFWRALQKMPGNPNNSSNKNTEQEYLREEVQKEYRRLQSETDPLSIQMAIKDGQRKLAQLQSIVGYTATTTPKSNDVEGDSWLDTKDPDDPRGRVGTEWPWKRTT